MGNQEEKSAINKVAIFIYIVQKMEKKVSKLSYYL